MIEKITLIHTNDVHSNFQNWVYLAFRIRDRKSALENRGENVILIDGGDHLDISVPECSITKGRINIDMLNDLCYDVLGVGNNELSRFSQKQLEKLFVSSKAPWLLSNVLNNDGSPIAQTKLSHIISTRNNIKVGFIGITDQFGNLYENSFNYSNVNTMKAISNCIEDLRKQGVSFFVLVSHAGYEQDIEIAEKLGKDINIIVGAHSHTLLKEPIKVNDTLIVQVGSNGEYFGELSLNFCNSTNDIISYNYMLHGINEINLKDKAQELIFHNGLIETEEFLNQEVLYVENGLEHKELINFLAKAMRDYYKTDIGLMIGAAAKGGFEKGNVRIRDIYETCASLICVAKLEMTGKQIIGLLRERLNKSITSREVNGYGFRPRGLKIGDLSFDGVSWEEVEGNVVNVKINNKSIDINRWYTVGTGEHLHIVDACGYPSLEGTKVIEIDDFLYVKDVLISYLKKKSLILY